MVQLRRDAAKLLNMVGGKRHASEEDHEEPPAKRRISPVIRTTQNDDDINAEPESSDDDLRRPPPRTKHSSKAKIPVVRSPTTNSAEELKVPQRKPGGKQPVTQHALVANPRTARADKANKAVEDDKENTSAGTPRSSATSVQDDGFNFSMEHASQRSNKSASAGPKKFGSKNRTTNIHSRPPVKKSKIPKISVPRNHTLTKKATVKTTAQVEDDASDCSIASLAELNELLGPDKAPDPELKGPAVKAKTPKQGKPGLELPKMSSQELEAELAELHRLNPKPTRLQNQLGDWMKDQALESSQPPSSAPEEALENLDEYLGQLPKEEEEGSRCAICKAHVLEEDYWDFWKGKAKTVRNQNTFCRVHREKSAWEEYRSEGYPDIDWSALSQRIRKHRMTLYKILNNDRPSAYRDRYEPIALTGKAATVPSKRKDLPEHVQEELESYALDDQSTYPGYYGPHGRRVITENVMKVLKNEIKNCTDAVVQGSGPATFIQAVLVPEAAILLIMEDCRVDKEEAEEIREKTYDMGMLLNEEIEDQVEVLDQSEDDNEYFGK